MTMRYVLNVVLAAIAAMAIALCAGCGKKPLFNLTETKEQESRIVSRTKLVSLHPDSAVIAGKVFTSQAVCDVDSILTMNGKYVHIDVGI